MHSVIPKLGTITPAIYFKLFDSQIQPILLYGSEIWGCKVFYTIEKIHLLACKKFLNVSISTPSNMVYGECGRFPLYIVSHTRCLKYWLKIICMPDHRLPRKAYTMLVQLDNLGKNNWASCVRTLLFSYGFGFVWLSQSIGNVNMFLKQFQIRAIDMFKQDWHSELGDSSRYDVYRQFKSLLQTEFYLSYLPTTKLRNTFIRFRLGLNELMVNKGRYSKTEKSLRICPCCELGVEDEYHFLLICPVYYNIRKSYLPSYLHNYNHNTFINLISTQDFSVLMKLSIFIQKAFTLRTELLS